MKYCMPRCYWMDLVVYLLGFILIVSYTECITSFISTPPSNVYASLGETATLTWKYTVENRLAEFQNHSPTWHLYLANGTVIQLAYENKHSRTWNLSITCPSRLRDRLVIKNSNSLVIKETTINDSGTYGCTLYLTNGSPLTSRARLVVTETPNFTSPLPRTVVRREGQDLDIDCVASGNPTPVVKWVWLDKGKKVIKSQGNGRATLSIPNIRREQNGTYECQASNNPNVIVTNQTDVLVEYRPSIDSILSSSITVASWDNHTVSLRCITSGNPTPQVTWTGPNKNPIKYGASPLKKGGLLTIETKYNTDYGQYRCRASNTQGYVYRFIDVKRIVVPHPPVLLGVTSTVSTIEIRWRSPTLNGGSPVIGYHISIDTNSKPSRAVSVKVTSVIIAGLAKATKYQVKVMARNVVGFSNETSAYRSTKTEETLAKEQISGTVVLGVCLPLIFILLLVIVLMLVYNWWKRRKRKNAYTQPENTSPNTETSESPKQVDAIELEEGRRQKQNGTASSDPPQKDYNGSCLPFYMKRQKRRPGKSKQPRPLVILESITEENAEEDSSTEESPRKKQDKNDNVQGESNAVTEKQSEELCEEPSELPSEEESTAKAPDTSSTA